MSVSTLRPNAAGPSSSTGFALTGGATSWGVTNDDDDATYLTGSGLSAIIELAFDDFTLPAGAVISRLDARLRWRRLTFPPQYTISVVNGINGAILGTGPTLVNWGSLTTTTAASAASSALTDAIADAAYVRIESDSVEAVRISEAYLDVTYVDQPAINVTAPVSPVENTTMPTVVWDRVLDSSGGAQTHYQVRVFTAAQVALGGFDPGSTTAVAETDGEVAGDALEWEIDDALPDDSYRAYVWIAQTVNGVQHWSDPDYIDFDVAVIRPGAPTMALTSQGTNGRIKIDLAGGIVDHFATNTISDYTFDTGSGTLAVSSGQLVPSSTAEKRLYRTGLSLADTQVTLKASTNGSVDGAHVGVMIKRLDTSNFLLAEIDTTNPVDHRLKLIKRDGGTYTDLVDDVTPILSVLGTYWVRITAVGDDITVELFDTTLNNLVADFTHTLAGGDDTQFGAGIAGNVGIRTNLAATSWRYDDFEVLYGPVSADAFEVQRSVDGTTWESVRTLQADGLIAPDDLQATVFDYEAPNSVRVTYRARALHSYSGLYAASAWATGAATWAGTSWWLKHPTRPALNTTVTVMGYEGTRSARQGVFQPLGATYPVVVSDTRASAAGSLTLRTDDATERDALDALLDTLSTLLLQGPPSDGDPDRYVRLADHGRGRLTGRSGVPQRAETLPWVEVAAPSGAVEAWPAS